MTMDSFFLGKEITRRDPDGMLKARSELFY